LSISEAPTGVQANPTALTAEKGKDDTDIFDLLIVGGGATGAGVALDAASRGLKVACVEREDFSSGAFRARRRARPFVSACTWLTLNYFGITGTSSKSTKLVHGGVRYLQKAIFELDYEQWKLVKEALRERKIFLTTAPHLSHMLP
jgi:glycerol-3-phosphate dehydrogenase